VKNEYHHSFEGNISNVQVVMNTEQIKTLLAQVSQISKHYDKIAQISGENFNTFRILNIGAAEVRLHSSFIAELLSPSGTHGQGSLYLKLFIKHLKEIEIFKKLKALNSFDSESAVVEVEKYIGKISDDYKNGGRLDILLSDKNGNHISIENKIYAKDQENQLTRYHNFYPEGVLIYLNLDGSAPSEYSIKGLKENQYQVVSYKKEIFVWLEQCLKESVSLPIIRETISQYLHLIKHLTNQASSDKMIDEVKTLIKENPEYSTTIEQCHQAVTSIIEDTYKNFKASFEELYPKEKGINVCNGINVDVKCGEDSDGVFFSYEFNFDSCDKALLEHIPGIWEKVLNGKPGWGSNDKGYFTWFNPAPFSKNGKFNNLDKVIIIELSSDAEKMKAFIGDLIKQEADIRKELFLELRKHVVE